MSRTIQRLNFAGVLILAALCGRQWSANQRLTDANAHLEQARRDQAATLADLSEQLKDNAAELTDLRERLDISESTRHADESKLAILQSDRDRLAAESDQLKKSLTAWITACTARDAAIKQANSTITTLSARYVDAMAEYNALVAKYNHSVISAQTKP